MAAKITDAEFIRMFFALRGPLLTSCQTVLLRPGSHLARWVLRKCKTVPSNWSERFGVDNI